VALVTILVARTVTFGWRSLTFRPPSEADWVTVHGRRQAKLRQRLSGQRVVGYRSDGQDIGSADQPPLWGFANPAALVDYFLTQYDLAPVVVLNTPRAPLVVGHFPGVVHLDAGRLGTLVEVASVGNGLFLLRNPDPAP
jgi:hypothetical protein